MPKTQKSKTKKAVVKRYKLTKGNKLLRSAANTTHLGRKNDSSTNSRKKRKIEVLGKFKKKLIRMLKG